MTEYSPKIPEDALYDAYAAMAADEAREEEAVAWAEIGVIDMALKLSKIASNNLNEGSTYCDS